MNSTMFNELKSFRDSLSNSFWLFSLGLEVREPSRFRAAFDALLDHELSNLERRLVEKEELNSMSHMYLENRMTFPPKEQENQEEEKEVSVHPPTLVIHPEPSVVVTKYEAPPTLGNEIKFLGKREEPVVLAGTDDEDEEVEAEEVEEEPEDAEEEAEEAEEEEDEGTEGVKVGKKKYHVGLVSRTVYEYIDEDSMGEALGTLTNGKIIAV